jgi:hypothetical protein
LAQCNTDNTYTLCPFFYLKAHFPSVETMCEHHSHEGGFDPVLLRKSDEHSLLRVRAWCWRPVRGAGGARTRSLVGRRSVLDDDKFMEDRFMLQFMGAGLRS